MLSVMEITPFGAGPWDLNIIGLRVERTPGNINTYCDWVYWLARDDDRRWASHGFPCTTVPGRPYLEKPINKAGAGIIAEGLHRGCWRPGLHKSRHKALVQVKPMRIHRDNDLDAEPETYAPPMLNMGGFNLHSVVKDRHAKSPVNRASAGCVDVIHQEGVDILRSLVGLQARSGFGNAVSFRLISEMTLCETGWRA